jgi:hypothetical protein
VKERKKQVIEQQVKPGGGDSPLDMAAGLPAVDNIVHVSSGPYAEDLPIAGMTVGEARRRFKDRFDIGDGAQAILDGKQVGDDVMMKAGESLMFIMHAGEKGATQTVLIEGDKAIAKCTSGIEGSMPVEKLLSHSGMNRPHTGNTILPNGVRAVFSQGNITLMFWERPPHIAHLSWIAENSPCPYGSGTKYRNVRIALPYLIIAATFYSNGKLIEGGNECFFRNKPLQSVNDELLYPALLNCSVMRGNTAPLAWICTQYLKQQTKMNDPFANGLESVRYCLLETSFNLSSEHHEGNSWFGASRKAIKEISSVEEWEKNTAKDPLFATGVNWLPTKHTVATFAERTFKRLNAAQTSAKNASDLARIVFKQTNMGA